MLATSANASPVSPPSTVTKGNDKSAPLSLLEACAGTFEKIDGGHVAKFPNGAIFRVLQHPSGLPQAYIYTAADGTESMSQVSDYLQEIEHSAPTASDEVKKSEAYTKLQRQTSLMFRTLVASSCKQALAKQNQRSIKGRLSDTVSTVTLNAF